LKTKNSDFTAQDTSVHELTSFKSFCIKIGWKKVSHRVPYEWGVSVNAGLELPFSLWYNLFLSASAMHSCY